MLRLPLFFSFLVTVLTAQDPSAPSSPQAPAAPKVEVPTFANATCPIMGKKVSMPLFVDTDLGRFYVCCKPCYKKILADVPKAWQTAYPVVAEAKNTVCPVSGEPIGELAVEVTLQGSKFKVCCEGCVAMARTHSQVTLAKVTQKDRTDVGNDTCPVTGKPVVANAFVVVDTAIVHLAEPKAADEVAKDPAGMLAKARAIAAAQPKKPKHEHSKPAAKDPGKTEGK
jgi:hypothetical protein